MTFSQGGSLPPKVEEYLAVKQAIIRKFGRKASPEEKIRKAVSATLHSMDILGSIKIMDSLYGKAGFSEETKYCLRRNSAMKHPDLAQCVITGHRQPMPHSRRRWRILSMAETHFLPLLIQKVLEKAKVLP